MPPQRVQRRRQPAKPRSRRYDSDDDDDHWDDESRELKFRIIEAKNGHARRLEFSTTTPLSTFVESIIRFESEGEVFPSEPGWTYDIKARGKSLIELDDKNKAAGKTVRLGKLFPRGGTVNWCIYDEDGVEQDDSFIWGDRDDALFLELQQARRS
ncbi:hypothetical protein ABW21_db0205803 [Orbilia brochopaga]|nr:hypothetical protein ABW21_db0205803 [Drechslerella brochopaga]